MDSKLIYFEQFILKSTSGIFIDIISNLNISIFFSLSFTFSLFLAKEYALFPSIFTAENLGGTWFCIPRKDFEDSMIFFCVIFLDFF